MKTSKKNKTKSLKHRMNRTDILCFYMDRVRRGDNQRIAEETGYSESHISNVKARRRNINDKIANAMYHVSRRRMKQTA
jgi:hypothetical protein